MSKSTKKIIEILSTILLFFVFVYFFNYIIDNAQYNSKLVLLFHFPFTTFIIILIVFTIGFGLIFSIIHLILKKLSFKIDKFERYIKVLGSDKIKIIIDKQIKHKIDKEILEKNYFRDIPCGNDIFMIYYLAMQYYICDKEVLQKGLIGALLLKWFYNKNIIIKKERNNQYIKFNKLEINDALEKELFEILKKASRNNGVLEKNEFEIWSKDNYLTIVFWLNKVEYQTVNSLIEYNLIEITKVYSKHKEAKFSSTLYETALKISGLKNFLNDFTNIDNKESIDVNLLENYLICAELLGVADKIKKEFSDLYPEAIQMINFDFPAIDLIDDLLDSIIQNNPDNNFY